MQTAMHYFEIVFTGLCLFQNPTRNTARVALVDARRDVAAADKVGIPHHLATLVYPIEQSRLLSSTRPHLVYVEDGHPLGLMVLEGHKLSIQEKDIQPPALAWEVKSFDRTQNDPGVVHLSRLAGGTQKYPLKAACIDPLAIGFPCPAIVASGSFGAGRLYSRLPAEYDLEFRSLPDKEGGQPGDALEGYAGTFHEEVVLELKSSVAKVLLYADAPAGRGWILELTSPRPGYDDRVTVAVRNLPLDATFGLAPLVHSTVPDRHFRWFYELLDGEIVEHDRRLPHRRGVESAGAATKESLLRRLFHRGLPHGASGGGSGEAHPRCVPSQYP